MKLIKNAYLAVDADGNTIICGSKPVRWSNSWIVDSRVVRWSNDPGNASFRRVLPRGYMVSIKGQTWKDDPICIGDVSI